jgi:selenocysteine lyase/cysteine desulfurase
MVARRSLLMGGAVSALSAAMHSLGEGLQVAVPMLKPAATALPVKDEFVVRDYEVCLNNARWHPMSRGARQAVIDYLDYKSHGVVTQQGLTSPASIAVRYHFAELIGAKPDEIAFVNSTTAGENMVVAGLGLHQPGKGNIVTDALHFEGSLYLYQELMKRGVDVRIVKPRGWQIDPKELKAAIDKQTKLVAISKISFINGFEHDLNAICKVAHAHGALVYVDAVQAAGCTPVDVRESGVDFLGSASYKWLQGDFGLGFLYAREDALPKIERAQWSFRQTASYDYHAFPGDPAGTFPASYQQLQTAAGYFELGTYANSVLAALSYSLPWIQQIGPAKIQTHALELNAKLRSEMPKLGYECITPEDARGTIIAFAVKDNAVTAAKLKAKKVDVGLNPGRMRVSPSIYNTMADVDALLMALS